MQLGGKPQGESSRGKRERKTLDLLFSYNIKIKVDEYVKLKLLKMNLQSQYYFIFNIVKKNQR